MPSATVKSSTGTTKFKYTISTPSNASAKAIDKNLPTVLFIPAVYLQRDIFHLQFGDPKLRRFNLVTFDLRAHGETTGTKMPKGYGQQEAAEDVVQLMVRSAARIYWDRSSTVDGVQGALNLPACHVVGLSLGSIIALQMAISYPEKVASLFFVSPLGLEEPDYVTAARVEIYDYWTEGFLCQTGTRTDDSALLDAFYGACQFAFSNKTNSLTAAYTAKFLPLAKKNWGPENFDVFHRATVDFFTQRKAHPIESLRKIQVPMKLVHGMDDIPYPVEYSMRQEQIFREAGLKVTLHKLSGAPHFAVVDLKMEVNQLIHDFVLENSPGKPTVIPPAGSILSPWDDVMRKAGWVPEEEEDDDVEFVQ